MQKITFGKNYIKGYTKLGFFLKRLLGPSGHTFEDARTKNDISTLNINLKVEQYPPRAGQKNLGGPDWARGPHLAHPWSSKFSAMWEPSIF